MAPRQPKQGAKTLEDLFSDKPKEETPMVDHQLDPFASIGGGGQSSDLPDDVGEDESFAGPEDDDEEFEENFTGESAGGVILEDGIHQCRCTDVELTKSSKGDPMYIWDFRTTNENAQLKLFTSLTAKARWKVIETLEGLGIEASDRVVRFKKSDVRNKVCYVQTEREMYKGRWQNSVVRVMTEAQATAAQSE